MYLVLHTFQGNDKSAKPQDFIRILIKILVILSKEFQEPKNNRNSYQLPNP